MKDLLVKIAKKIVKYPDQVSVKEFNSGHTTCFELAVAKEDIKLIIGRKGQTINAIRTIIRGAGGKINKRIVIEVVEYLPTPTSANKRPQTEQVAVSA